MGEPAVRVGPASRLSGATRRSCSCWAEDETTQAIDGYIEAIGDLEQRPPGVEEAIDPLLRRNPVGGGFPDWSHLPGNVKPDQLVASAGPNSAPNLEVEHLTV